MRPPAPAAPPTRAKAWRPFWKNENLAGSRSARATAEVRAGLAPFFSQNKNPPDSRNARPSGSEREGLAVEINLHGKTAIVTGSSQGIGRATAETLHACGANVVINWVADPEGRNRERAEAVVRGLGTRAIMLDADVRYPDQLDHMVAKTVGTFGSLDILVNNAGILRDRSFRKMSQAEWQDVIDTNLTGVFNSCKSAVEHLADGGAIVNVASLSAVTGFFGQANYASAKAGVMTLTRVLSRELARRGIRVNAVAPGVVNTEMGESIPEENRKAMLDNVPLARFAEPSEIASVIAFLASDLASYVTGQTIHVNGGWWS
jgi:3-oxoacyl-[acyl-carrier protein] reductase